MGCVDRWRWIRVLSRNMVFDLPMRCPICRRAFVVDPALRPRPRFCSDRCRTIDLGNWLSGSYAVTAPINEDDVDPDFAPTPAAKEREDA
jgi:endogenous inhibitor of DNA gyrase (YacG/DUF329 family)